MAEGEKWQHTDGNNLFVCCCLSLPLRLLVLCSYVYNCCCCCCCCVFVFSMMIIVVVIITIVVVVAAACLLLLLNMHAPTLPVTEVSVRAIAQNTLNFHKMVAAVAISDAFQIGQRFTGNRTRKTYVTRWRMQIERANLWV